MNTEHTKHPCEAVEANADVMKLAEMILSDCGCSTAISDSLQRRVAGRIQQHMDSALGSQQQAEPVALDVIAKLSELARVVNIALDDSEERDGMDGREHVIDSVNFDAVCDALEALENLPDDKPGRAMSAADKAEWALRHLTDAAPPAVADGRPKNYKKLAEWLGHENAALRNQAVAVPDDWRDAMERAAEDLEDNNCLESAHQLRAMLAAAPQATAEDYSVVRAAVAVPDEVAKDAARYRWLRQDESEFSSMAPAELDAAIDKAIAATKKGGAA